MKGKGKQIDQNQQRRVNRQVRKPRNETSFPRGKSPQKRSSVRTVNFLVKTKNPGEETLQSEKKGQGVKKSYGNRKKKATMLKNQQRDRKSRKTRPGHQHARVLEGRGRGTGEEEGK